MNQKPLDTEVIDFARTLERELNEAHKQFGTCSVCGNCSWVTRPDGVTEDCGFCKLRDERDQLKAELERLKKWSLIVEDFTKIREERDQLKIELEELKLNSFGAFATIERLKIDCQQWHEMARELASNLVGVIAPWEGHPVKDCDEKDCVICGCDKALARFNAMEGESK